MPSTGNLLRALQAAEPAIDVIVAAHIADNAEVLPHLLLAEIARWMLAKGPNPRVLSVLEQYLVMGEPDVQDLIAVSFVENLIGGEGAVRWALGPRLAAELRRMEEWRPESGDSPT